MWGIVAFQHASLTHMIDLANQNDLGEYHLQAYNDAANQNKLRHSITQRSDVTLVTNSSHYFFPFCQFF